MITTRAATLGLALCASLLAAVPARAADSFTRRHTTGSLGGRRGLALAPGVTATPWAYGVGGRLGFTSRSGFYLGLAADSYLLDRGIEHYPGSESATIRGTLGTAATQLGYDWGLRRWLTLRWIAGFGVAWGALDRCTDETTAAGARRTVCKNGPNPRGAVSTGLSLLGRVTKKLYLSGSTEWLIDTAFEDRTTGIIFGFDVGWRF